MRGEFTLSYLERSYQRYHQASKTEKGRILDDLCRVCQVTRKYAIRRLSQPLSAERPKARPRRPRTKTYGPALLAVIKAVWEEAHYPWSLRLKEILRLWLPYIRKRFPLSPQLEKPLLTISPSTLDRALKPYKRALKRRLYGRTKPGTLLRHQIPIQTKPWSVDRPGSVEVDLVAHCGQSASGEFLWSLNLTDIFSGWVETRAVMGKSETGVLLALREIRQALPFSLQAIDSDNGSEFINHHLWRYCHQEHIQFTRSRPYKKDDNAHIEQKNWTHVRKLLGWDRYDSPQALELINNLYRQESRLFMNLFQPSVRLVKTLRVGSRLTRHYDAPQTPLDRLLSVSRQKLPEKLAQLKTLRELTDPFQLSHQLSHKLEHLWRLTSRPHQTERQTSKPPPTLLNEITPGEKDTLKSLAQIFRMKAYYPDPEKRLFPPPLRLPS